VCSKDDVKKLKEGPRDTIMRQISGNRQMTEIFETLDNQMQDLLEDYISTDKFQEDKEEILDSFCE
jgi:hypothetical protein